ncbi:MAG TPA: zf-TFIIB domain-containing protein, partial [Candidatus Methylacidiphilales bacterium]|nr:zf-TFIIB domain-containing protein [Candidatus Methylacidiphilales bacterium]
NPMKSTCQLILLVCAMLGLLSSPPLRALSFNLVDGEPIHTQAELNSLHTGDTLVLTCPNCGAGGMITYNSDKDSPGHVKWMKPGFTMTCPHCGAKLTATERDGKIVYVCDKCDAVGTVTAYKTSKR